MSRKKSSTERAPRKLRRTRHVPSVYESIRTLETLNPTSAHPGALALLCDVLALWARHMMALNPNAAAHVYRALCDAWGENRRELYDELDMDDPRDRATVAYHGAFRARLGELLGKKPDRIYPGDRRESEKLLGTIQRDLVAMCQRAVAAAAPNGEAAREMPDESPDELPAGDVVDLSCWAQSHPRPVRNLLFQEKGGAQ